MELTSDLFQAQVVIIYLRRVQMALYIDRRVTRDEGPLARLAAEAELLLEGRDVRFPLTPVAVAEIERRQFRSPDPVTHSAYFAQLKEHLEDKVRRERPLLPAPALLCVAPHYAPIMVLAHNRFFLRMVEQTAGQEHPAFIPYVKDLLRQLYVQELERPEAIRQTNLDRLIKDFASAEEWAVFARPEG
ncbi:MAG: hypothetical protein HY681_10035 [Chloroflexi bacterium]|nr:hypothetical protein [Chloroflexota bacterium]